MPGAKAAKQQGFTLMELIITMVIVAIVAGFGVPSFTEFLRRGEMTSRANSAIVALQLARSEAISRGRPVMACASTDGTSCTGDDWAAGWLVATDPTNPGTVDAGETVLRVSQENTKVDTAAAAPAYVRFLENGLSESSNPQTIRLTRPDCGAGEAREIQISATGRAQVNKADC